MSSEVVRWFAIDDDDKKCKRERDDRRNKRLHDRISECVVQSIVLKLVFLVLVINLNVGLVLGDNGVYGPEDDDGYGHYTPHWAVHIPDASDETAQRVADEHGFIYLGKVSRFRNFVFFKFWRVCVSCF